MQLVELITQKKNSNQFAKVWIGQVLVWYFPTQAEQCHGFESTTVENRPKTFQSSVLSHILCTQGISFQDIAFGKIKTSAGELGPYLQASMI